MDTIEIFEDIMYSFQRCIDSDKVIRHLTVEQFLKKYNSFYYNNRCFIFNTRIGCHPDNYKGYTFILGLYNTRPINGESQIVRYHIETIKQLFPFLKLELNEYGEYYSESYDSSLLLETLPTRINIINSIIKDLEND